MPTLLRAHHFSIVHHVASGYVVVARIEQPFASPDEAEQALAECDHALQKLCAPLGILLDWRPAPMSPNARLHKVLVEFSDCFTVRFARRALLTRTPVGTMRGARIVREQSATSPVMFLDEEDAVAHVCGRRDLEPA